MKDKKFVRWVYLLLTLWLAFWMVSIYRQTSAVETISYSDFLTALSQGRTSDLMIGESTVEGNLQKDSEGEVARFEAVRPDDPALIERLTEAGVSFSAAAPRGNWGIFLIWFLPMLLIFGLWILFIGRMGQMGKSGPMALGKTKAKVYVETDLKVRFSDVAGVDEAKQELLEIVSFLKNPAHISRLGGRMPKGILLVGPPGTGKTLLARAIAGEAAVPFFSINGSEFVELFVGVGAARVRDLFEQARKRAPCIIFIDELDALGKSRALNQMSGGSNDEKEQTLNQLLAEMDGFDSSEGVVLLSATNRPEVLDPALMRAGRFDRQLLIDKPDKAGRAQILKVHLKKIKVGNDVELDLLASVTPGFSGADLANLVNEAALIATRRSADVVEQRDFGEAIERIVAGVERRSRIISPDEKRRVAYHEMGHALIGLSLGKSEVVHKVSIIPRGLGALGYTHSRSSEERYLMSKSDIQKRIVVALGGRAAEEYCVGEISTGAADDLDKATEMARAMVTRFGMSANLGLATFERNASPHLGGQGTLRSLDYSEKTAQVIDEEVKEMLNDAYAEATSIIRKHRDFVEVATGVLLHQETIDEQELKSLWEAHLGRMEKGLSGEKKEN